MRFFRKPVDIKTPPQVVKLRKETHEAAREATKELVKMNDVMSNGVTLSIYYATGGRYHN
jgi:hypothetical protein